MTVSDDMIERLIKAAEINAEANGRIAVTLERMDDQITRAERRDEMHLRVLRGVGRVLRETEAAATKGRETAVKQLAALIDLRMAKAERRREWIILVIAIITAVALIVKAIDPETLWKHFLR